MQKTLLLTHEYFPFSGGVATYCHSLFRNLPAERYLIVTDCTAVKSGNNIFKIRLISKNIWPHWLPGLFGVLRLVQKEKVQILFTPNILPLGSIAFFVKLLTGRPYIVSLHGLDINLAMKNKAAWTKIILKNAKHVICNTNYTATLLKNYVAQEKISIIYPSSTLLGKGCSTEHVRALREKYSLAGKKVILTVGRLVSRKGHVLVLEALRDLDRSDWRYLIAGEGPELENLQNKIKEYHLEEKVILLGRVADEELPCYYQAADIFVLPHQLLDHDVEGFGIVFLEAASFALPIIAGQSGGVSEIFSGQDDVVYVKSADDIKQAIADFLQDTSRVKKFGQNALKVSEKFALEEQKGIKLLDNLLN